MNRRGWQSPRDWSGAYRGKGLFAIPHEEDTEEHLLLCVTGKPVLTLRQIEDGCSSGSRIELRGDEVHVWAVVLAAETDVMAWCRQYLSAEESARADRLMSEQHRCHFTAAHGALRMVLSRYAETAPRELSIQNLPSGKPVLRGTSTHPHAIRFNLSHSHGRALIAVAKDREVGVDLEKIRVSLDVVALAKRFFAPQEYESIVGAGPADMCTTFFRIWVAKEAALKAQGRGLTFPLDRHRIELSEDGTACRITSENGSKDIVPQTIQFLPLETDWVAAVSAEGNAWSITRCW